MSFNLLITIDHPIAATCSGQSITKIPSPSTPSVTTLLQKSAPGNYHKNSLTQYSFCNHPAAEICSGQLPQKFPHPVLLLEPPCCRNLLRAITTKIPSPSTPSVTTLLQKSAPGNYHSLYMVRLSTALHLPRHWRTVPLFLNGSGFQ